MKAKTKYPVGSVVVVYRNVADLILQVVAGSKKGDNPSYYRIRSVPEPLRSTPMMGDSHCLHDFDRFCLMGAVGDPDIQEKINAHTRGKRYKK